MLLVIVGATPRDAPVAGDEFAGGAPAEEETT
jgi:hypothetical protein